MSSQLYDCKDASFPNNKTLGEEEEEEARTTKDLFLEGGNKADYESPTPNPPKTGPFPHSRLAGKKVFLSPYPDRKTFFCSPL